MAAWSRIWRCTSTTMKTCRQFGAIAGTGQFGVFNLRDVDLRGGEFELKWAAADGLDFIAGIGYIDKALIVDTDVAYFDVEGNEVLLEGNRLPRFAGDYVYRNGSLRVVRRR